MSIEQRFMTLNKIYLALIDVLSDIKHMDVDSENELYNCVKKAHDITLSKHTAAREQVDLSKLVELGLSGRPESEEDTGSEDVYGDLFSHPLSQKYGRKSMKIPRNPGAEDSISGEDLIDYKPYPRKKKNPETEDLTGYDPSDLLTLSHVGHFTQKKKLMGRCFYHPW